MPTCRHCGTEVPPDATACLTCGTPVPDPGEGRPLAGGRDDQQAGREHANRQSGQARTRGQASQPGGDTQGSRSNGTGQPARHGSAPPRRTATPAGARAAGHPDPPSTPTGLQVVAGLVGLAGVLQLLGGFLLLDAGGRASGYGVRGAGSSFTLLALVLVLLGVGYLAVAGGLWTVRSWGWPAGVALLGLGTLGTLVLLANGASGVGTVLGLFVNAGALGYLLLTRQQYRYRSRARHGG